MGTFKIEITAVGGHGVDRTKINGEVVDSFAEGTNTPDAKAKLALQALQEIGCSVSEAKIIHWPGTESEVTDDLITGIRTGHF